MAGRNMLEDDLSLPGFQFAKTELHACSYLPDHSASSLVVMPPQNISIPVYNHLIRAGFRRSGLFIYRPDCPNCRACQPVRLPVLKLTTDRSQRRALRQHGHMETREVPLAFYEEHYSLYQRYQHARHAGGGMDEDDKTQYARSMLESRVDTRLVEFREEGKLRMVSLIDVLSDGLSSVYCFFDPKPQGASFGTYNILWQTGYCLRLGLPYLYLGYWIMECRKMAYKTRFRPIEQLDNGCWQEFSAPG